jgi:hypothetical protein
MRKLVTVESGMLEPLDPSSDNAFVKILITENTRLIIEGDDVTMIYEDGHTSFLPNHRLALFEDSNYREQPLTRNAFFFIKIRSKIADIRSSFSRFLWVKILSPLKRFFQTVFGKYHISDYDLGNLDAYLAERILPKIKAYRNKYLQREVREFPPLLFEDEQIFHDVPLVCSDGEMSDEEKAWVAVMDEIIFAMRWLIEKDTSKEPAFYREYYGKYASIQDDSDEYFKLTKEAEKRAQSGFEAFGKFFTSFWY